jgi:hypothetical protein
LQLAKGVTLSRVFCSLTTLPLATRSEPTLYPTRPALFHSSDLLIQQDLSTISLSLPHRLSSNTEEIALASSVQEPT